MNLDEFKLSNPINAQTELIKPKDNIKKIGINDISNLDSLENQLKEKFSLKGSIVEGSPSSRILFFYGKCANQDKKILDGPMGELFDKMLSSIYSGDMYLGVPAAADSVSFGSRLRFDTPKSIILTSKKSPLSMIFSGLIS